jgi:hypothetical protein
MAEPKSGAFKDIRLRMELTFNRQLREYELHQQTASAVVGVLYKALLLMFADAFPRRRVLSVLQDYCDLYFLSYDYN